MANDAAADLNRLVSSLVDKLPFVAPEELRAKVHEYIGAAFNLGVQAAGGRRCDCAVGPNGVRVIPSGGCLVHGRRAHEAEDNGPIGPLARRLDVLETALGIGGGAVYGPGGQIVARTTTLQSDRLATIEAQIHSLQQAVAAIERRQMPLLQVACTCVLRGDVVEVAAGCPVHTR